MGTHELKKATSPLVNDSLPSLVDKRETDQLKIIEIMSRQASWRDPIPEDAAKNGVNGKSGTVKSVMPIVDEHEATNIGLTRESGTEIIVKN